MKIARLFTTLVVLVVIGSFLYAVTQVIDPLDYINAKRDERKKADLIKIQAALEAYYNANSQYPLSTGNNNNPCDGDFLIKDRNPNTKELEPIHWGTNWFGFLEPIPSDASWSTCYVYVVSPSRQSYWLYTSLTRGRKDPQACGNPGVVCNNLEGNGATEACKKAGKGEQYNCNWGVTSANTAL